MKPMTRENVEAAFAGEAMAHIRYLAYARQAEREGYSNVARLFRAIAASEKRHALRHLDLLGEVGSTDENLEDAYETEDYEIRSVYPAFSEVAKLEGENDAEEGYHYAIEAEKNHRPLYEEAKSALDADRDADDGPVSVCRRCGRTVRGDAPERCPICNAPGEDWEVY